MVLVQVVVLPIAIGKMTANFSTHVFSPQHCGCDRLTSIDDVKQCLTEYIYWSSYAYRNRQCAGQLYSTLLSFRDDAELVFIDIRELVKICRGMMSKIVQKSSVVIYRMSKNHQRDFGHHRTLCICCYLLGGEDHPTSNSLNALFVMLEMLNYVDYNIIFRRMN